MDSKLQNQPNVKAKQSNIFRLLPALLLAVLLAVSCRKTDLPQEPPRLFRPVLKDQLMAEGNWVSASWQSIRDAAGYTVELSRDTFRTIDATLTVDTNSVVFEDLMWNQLYQVQVRALASDTTKHSKMSFLGAIKTPRFPTILIAPTISDANDEAIRVRWTTSGDPVTSIKVHTTADNVLVKEVQLTEADVANEFRIITGLSAATDYTVYLYSGTTLRGWEAYTTKAPLSGEIVDLRGITDRPSVLADTLPLIPSGATVILKRGQVYEISSTVNLSKSVTITSGSDLAIPEPATLFFTSNFNIAEGSNIEYITFRDLRLQSDNYASRYVMNVNKASTIGKISFEASTVRVFRGVVRLQSTTITVSDFVVDNCLVDSISNYGVLSVDNVKCKVDNILLQNSTFFRVEKVITSRQNSNSVVIENCTFHESPRGGNYFVDYSTSSSNNVAMGVKINNTILSIGMDNGSGVTAVRGVRVGGSTSVEASASYATSDYVATSHPIPSLIQYTRPSGQLFEDPANGNFKIVDNTFPGRSSAGDPRWRR